MSEQLKAGRAPSVPTCTNCGREIEVHNCLRDTSFQRGAATAEAAAYLVFGELRDAAKSLCAAIHGNAGHDEVCRRVLILDDAIESTPEPEEVTAASRGAGEGKT